MAGIRDERFLKRADGFMLVGICKLLVKGVPLLLYIYKRW